MLEKNHTISKNKNSLINNPILRVFTKEYREEINYIMFLEKNIDKFRLKSDNENIDEKIERLNELGYEPNFRIDYSWDVDKTDEKVKTKTKSNSIFK